MAHARVNVCITGGVRQAQEGAIASAGARAVVEAMREHPAHAAIQRKGCARLLDLTPSVEGAEYQRIRGENGGEWTEMDRKYRELASAGVIDVVCQALSTQPAEVAAMGCRILVFLACSHANQVQIARLGGIQALLAGLGLCPGCMFIGGDTSLSRASA